MGVGWDDSPGALESLFFLVGFFFFFSSFKNASLQSFLWVSAVQMAASFPYESIYKYIIIGMC